MACIYLINNHGFVRTFNFDIPLLSESPTYFGKAKVEGRTSLEVERGNYAGSKEVCLQPRRAGRR